MEAGLWTAACFRFLHALFRAREDGFRVETRGFKVRGSALAQADSQIGISLPKVRENRRCVHPGIRPLFTISRWKNQKVQPHDPDRRDRAENPPRSRARWHKRIPACPSALGVGVPKWGLNRKPVFTNLKIATNGFIPISPAMDRHSRAQRHAPIALWRGASLRDRGPSSLR